MLNAMPRAVPISGIKQETPLVRSYTFDYSVGAQPGQFVNVWIPGVNERPMSVAFDDGKKLTLSIAAVGDMTKKLATFKIGDLVGIRGPYGTAFHWKPRQRIVMVAGGYGVAPLYFCAALAIKDGCRVDFITGARSSEHLLFADRVRGLKNVNLHLATNDGSTGHKGFNTEILETLIKDGSKIDLIMTCGPEMMMKKVSDMAWKKKIQCQVSVERYMKCGFSICGNCVVDDLGITTCQSGPVMENSVVRKIKEFGVYHRDAQGLKHFY
ncbi:MAG: dihydroorotate dehydrogenase electron transfer subunit [Patescibacteria group bacterium]